MKTELLIEHLAPNEACMVTESATQGKDVWLKGIFMQAETFNRNRRKYPLSEMVSAVGSLNQQITENNGVFGELDHPETLTINLKNISHVITELKMDGNNVMGKARLLETPMGLIGKELIKSGVRTGVSSRGAGNVNNDGIVEGFNLITIDIVATPSAPGATPTSVYESLQSKLGIKVMTLAEQLQHDPSAQKHFKKSILEFIKSVNFAKK
jgi:hypothetical protein